MTTKLRSQNERGQSLSAASLGGATFNWKPNWIDHRTSLANVDRREARGETVETCEQCGAETDVRPAPHSPKCPTLGKAAPEPQALADRSNGGAEAGVATREAEDAHPVDDEPVGAASPSVRYKPPEEYKQVGEDLLYGCKIFGCPHRTARRRGATAYLCDGHAAAKSAIHGRAVRAGVARSRQSVVPPVVADAIVERASWIKVPGTGLAYRSSMEAYVAADEIEADGERVAESARHDGNDAKAEQAVDAARELAEKIRAAARGADERAGTVHVRNGDVASSEREPTAEQSGGVQSAPGAAAPAATAEPASPSDDGAPPLGPALRELVRAARDVLDALERELSIETNATAGEVARVVVHRLQPQAAA